MWTYPFLNPLYDFPTELPFCPFITTLNKMRFWKVVSATRYAIMRNGPTKHMQANSNSELRNIQNYNAAKVGLATLSAFVLSKSSFRFFENFCGILWIVQCFFFSVCLHSSWIPANFGNVPAKSLGLESKRPTGWLGPTFPSWSPPSSHYYT